MIHLWGEEPRAGAGGWCVCGFLGPKTGRALCLYVGTLASALPRARMYWLPCSSGLWRWPVLQRTGLQQQSWLAVTWVFCWGNPLLFLGCNFFFTCALGLQQAVCILSEGSKWFASPRDSGCSLVSFSRLEVLQTSAIFVLSWRDPLTAQLVLSHSGLW